ncbi:solute carrier family 22 member 10-like [Sorex fumeus]|uniref:solute carrier family 22 member 10-like n=1 Tax=Sorex fumeus TaxID=62283 RepID=UPI0024ACB1BF|nr:solute carrier family 22 member 10-like [Sorex fumeus]
MGFEELLNQVGNFGKFHIRQMALIFFISMAIASHIVLENFTAATPGHRCWVHIIDDDTLSINNTTVLNQDALLRISIPLDSNLRPEKCRRFVHPQWHLLHFNETFLNMSEPDTEPCVDGWVYDRNNFPSTIVTEWNLVCDNKAKKPMAQFLFLTGMLIGSFIISPLSDWLGRKFVLRCCLLTFSLCGIGAAFAPNFIIYCSLRFLMGCTATSIIINSSMLVTEWSRPQSKPLAVLVLSCAFSSGNILLGGLAYVFQEWRTLMLTLCVPHLVFFLTSRWIIESARWLIITNKPDKGLKALKRVARINGLKNAGETLNIEVVSVTMQQALEEAQKKKTVFDLVRTPNMRKRICLIAFVRSSAILSYYGIIVNLQHFGNNIFLFQTLFGIISTSARFLGFFVVRKTGHRSNQMFLYFLVGIFIFTTSLVPQEMQVLRVTLACVALSLISVAFNEYGVHFVELTPTVLRARASMVDSVSSRCGAALAPILMTLEMHLPILPWIFYSIAPILSAFLLFFLPETKDMPLPDTIEDVEKNHKKSRKENAKESCMKVTKF